MEVFCQRLDDEFDASIMITAPSVPYKSNIIYSNLISKHSFIKAKYFFKLKFMERKI